MAAKDEAKNEKGAVKVRSKLTHAVLDRTLLVALLLAAFKFGDPAAYLKKIFAGFMKFGNHYTPVFDWKKKPMDKFVAASVWLTGIYFLIKTYVVEREGPQKVCCPQQQVGCGSTWHWLCPGNVDWMRGVLPSQQDHLDKDCLRSGRE